MGLFRQVPQSIWRKESVVPLLPVQTLGQQFAQAQAKIYVPSSYYDTVLADAPTVWWRLGDTSGDFLDEIGALDLSPNGTVTRGVKNYRIKVDDGAVSFPTSSDYLSRADNAVFDLGNAGFSIEFWARRTIDSGGWEVIVSKGTGAYQVAITPNDWFAFTKGGVAILTISDYGVPADGTWHYYVVTRASTSDTRMYVDGVARTKSFDDTTTTLVDTSSAFHVGHDVTGGDPNFRGSVDELALYNYVLTPTQIANHYASRLLGTPDRVAYISPSGNDITGDGSLGNPWLNIPRGITSVCPGDTIQCRGGTYTVTSVIATGASGSSSRPIRVVPYPSEKPIFDGGGGNQVFLLLNNSSWIIVQDLFAQNYTANSSGILMVDGNSEGNIFRNITLTNIAGTNVGNTDHFVYFGGGVTPSTAPRNLLVENCWFEGVTGASRLNGGGFHVYSDSGGATPYTGQDITFRNNIVLNIEWGAIIWGNADNVQMIHNTFVNVDFALRAHSAGVTDLVFRDNLVLGNSTDPLILIDSDDTLPTFTEDYNFLSQGGSNATTVYSHGAGNLNQASWIAANGNGVHDIVPGSRTDSDFDAGWYPKSGSAVGAASDGFDMGRLQAGMPHAQAQAEIVVAIATLIVSAQSQGWIKATAQKAYSQAQARIKQTYNAHAQAQARIKQTYNAFAQAQSQIKQTYRGYAQAQANVKQTYRGFAQAQADIKQTYNAHGQAQARIKQTYNQFAQAQSQIKQTYNVFAQAQAQTKQVYRAHAQAQAQVKQTYNAFAQGQARIKQTYNGFAQAQATIRGNAFGQAQAWIKVTAIEGCGQAQADIKQTYNAFSQSQARIKQTYNSFGQAQARIKQVYQGYAQAQAWIEQTYNVFAQSQAWIETTYNQFAQAQAKINAFGVQGYGQTAARINAGGALYWLRDTFTRTESGTWGIPDFGPNYLTNDSAYLAVNGTHGTLTIPELDSADVYIHSPISAYNAESVIDYQNTGNDESIYFESYLRVSGPYDSTPSGTYIGFSLFKSGPDLFIDAFDSAFVSAQATIPVSSFFAPLRIKLRVNENHVYIKIWEISEPEPDWQVEYTTTVLTGGAATIYLTGYNSGGSDVQYPIINNWNVTEVVNVGFGQAQARILQTYQGYAQAQSKTIQTYNTFGQSQARILATYQGYANAQATIEQTYNQFAQAQARILTNYQAYAQAQAKLNAFDVQAYAQALANIKGIDLEGVGQAQAKINAFGVNAHGQVQAWIEATYNQFGQANADIKATSNAFAQAQATILQTYFGFAQANANIKQTYNQSGNAQADIKQTYQEYGQSQGQIKQVYNAYANAQGQIKQAYQAYGQAQARILQVYFGHGQANADILATSNVHANAQADIKQTYQAYGQAEAWIEQTYQSYAQAQGTILAVNYGHGQAQATIRGNAFGQAQADILQIYYGFAQAQSQIKQVYYAHGQALASILTRYEASGQAQADILATSTVHAQSQAQIKQVYQGYSNAQADILVTTNVHAQSQAQIKQTYQAYAQANARIIAFGVQQYAQAQAMILFTGNAAFAQAQAKINAFDYNQHGQSQAHIVVTDIEAVANAQARILTTYFGHGQANADILATSQAYGQAQGQIGAVTVACGNAQASIKTTYNAFAQSNADILATSNAHGQSQADILQIYQGYGQASVVILQIYQAYAQAQGWIEATVNSSGNAQALIKTTANGYGQTQAQIKVITQVYAQAQAYIILTLQGYGQAQGQIKQTYIVCAQAQGYIKTTQTRYAQAQAWIEITTTNTGQSQALIQRNVYAHGQSQAYIISGHFALAQAQAHIQLTALVNTGQAQGFIVKSAGYGQAQGYILVTHIIRNVTIHDRHSLDITLTDTEISEGAIEWQAPLDIAFSDRHSMIIILTDRHSIDTEVTDTQYEEGDFNG